MRFCRSPLPLSLPLLLLLALALSTMACKRQSTSQADDYSVELRTDPMPPQVGAGQLTLLIKDAAGAPVANARVSIEGTMAHAGMPSSMASLEPSTVPGEYPARIQWTMGGDWILIVRVEPQTGPAFEKRLDVPGVRVP